MMMYQNDGTYWIADDYGFIPLYFTAEINNRRSFCNEDTSSIGRVS